MRIIRIKRIFFLSLISFLCFLCFGLLGCTTTSSANKNQPTMAEVYHEAQIQSNSDSLQKTRNKVMWVKTNSKNNKNKLFQRLPNPEIVFYVYPHLAGTEETPVPGYTTSIPMFKEVHYALPGEI